MQDEFQAAAIELEQYLEQVSEAIAPTCFTCREYLPTCTPNMGICAARVCRVLGGDRSCSFYCRSDRQVKSVRGIKQ